MTRAVLNDDEINLLVAGLMAVQRDIAGDKSSKYFCREKTRDLRLLPDLIDKLNHAKNVTVTGRFKFDRFNCRFVITDQEKRR